MNVCLPESLLWLLQHICPLRLSGQRTGSSASIPVHIYLSGRARTQPLF